MARVYSCAKCGTNLNLKMVHLYPADFHFKAGNKGTLSFSSLDLTKIWLEKEVKCGPFFETVYYCGMQRARIKIHCQGCNCLIGHIYEDGPPLTNSSGLYFHFGPCQEIARAPRYRFKIKALKILTEN